MFVLTDCVIDRDDYFESQCRSYLHRFHDDSDWMKMLLLLLVQQKDLWEGKVDRLQRQNFIDDQLLKSAKSFGNVSVFFPVQK